MKLGRILDVGAVTMLVVVAAVLLYVQSRGGFARLFSAQDAGRRSTVARRDTIDIDTPPSWSDSTPSAPGILFANPIAQADGGDGTFIAPMSATVYGPVKITGADLADPRKLANMYQDPDKGLIFVALPEQVNTQDTPPPTHGDDASRLPDRGQYPDVAKLLKEWIYPLRGPVQSIDAELGAQTPKVPAF